MSNEAETNVWLLGREIKLSDEDTARFWRKVNKDGPIPDQSNPHYKGLEQCWEWTAGCFTAGYGMFTLNRTPFLAHRASWTIHFGDIPPKLRVLHRCDYVKCIRPEHLWLGTSDDNNKDKGEKGRAPRGVDNPEAKLSEENVLEIRARYAAGGTTLVALAAEFGVTFALIGCIVRRKIWRHI